MRPSVIKEKLRNDQVSLVVSVSFQDPDVFELVSRLGPDGIWLDMEHHRHSMEAAANLARGVRAGLSDLIMRPANAEWTRLSRMLEIGAQGIMYPRCRSAEEAKQVIEFAKFAPLGRRGFDGGGADCPYCDLPMAEYVQRANEETFVIIQLEEQAAVDRAEEIAAVDGVDLLMLGPGDFSVLEGFPGQMDHPKIAKAYERLAEAAKATGKNWAAIAFSPSHGQELVEQGARVLMHGADLLMVKQGVEKILQDFNNALRPSGEKVDR